MDEQEKLSALQALLTEAYLDYVSEHHKRKVGDNEFARYLGVSVGSFNQWINGNRLPSYDNVIKMAGRLGPKYVPRIFDILGYERVTVVNDPQVQFIASKWRMLSHDTRKQIIDHIKEETENREVARQTG